MRYAGFWPRALAQVIDFAVLLCLTVPGQFVFGLSTTAALAAYLFASVVGVGYPVYFHARWGQTLGKVLAKIKVTRIDGRRIGLGRALLRSSVDIGLTAVGVVGTSYMLVT